MKHRKQPPLDGDANRLRQIDYKWQALATVAIGTFMATLDSSIVNVSLPTLRREFGASLTTVEWVVMAYLLTITGLLLSLGRLADMVGRKRIYNLGFVIFTLGSLTCAISPGISALIASRALQAVGAAMLMANGTAILTAAFPRSERGKAMGLNGTIVATGLTVGPPLGGLILHYLGWRWIFAINLPVGMVGTLLGHRLLQNDTPPPHSERFDIPGALALLLGLSSLLLALSHGQSLGWAAAPTVTLLAGSLVCLGLFLFIECRTLHPAVDLSLFRNRLFSAGSASALISYMAVGTVVFLMPFYLREVRGYSTAQMGIMLTMVPLAMLFVSPLSGWLSDRIGSRFLSTAGLGNLAIGLVLLSGLDARASFANIAGRLILVGSGNGLFTSPNSSAIMGAVPPQRLGIASGVISTVRNMGMVMGVAVAGAVVATGQSALLRQGIPHTDAFRLAVGSAFLVMAGITATGMLPSLVRGGEERRAA